MLPIAGFSVALVSRQYQVPPEIEVGALPNQTSSSPFTLVTLQYPLSSIYGESKVPPVMLLIVPLFFDGVLLLPENVLRK